MKTVTDDFVAAQKRPDAVGVRQVYYKRRYWNNSTKAYVWESSWTLLGEDEIVSVSPVTWQLDNDQLNEYKVSNVTIVMDNADNRFRPDNESGFFAQDSVSPIHKYEPYWTKFQVKAGFLLPDGTSETIAIFNGVAVDYIMNTRDKTCEVSVQGLEALLLNAKAEGIATTITEENAGTGNGATTTFDTVHPGVGGITEVSNNGIKLVEGSDYTVSQLNESTLPARVTFAIAPSVGRVIRISYFYWPQSYAFEHLVTALLDSAGVTDYTVESVVFQNSVINSQQYTNASDWATWATDGMEAATSPGDLKIDWTDARFNSSTTYSTSLTGWSGNSDGLDAWTTDGTWLIGAATTAHGFIPYSRLTNEIYRSVDRKSGIWEFTFQFTTAPTNGTLFMKFMTSTSPLVSITVVGGGFLRLTVSQSGTVDFPLGSGPTYDFVGQTTAHKVTIKKRGDGALLVYVDDILGVTTTATVTASPTMYFQVKANASCTCKVKLIGVPPATAQVSATSPAINWGSVPTAWGQFTTDESLEGQVVTYQTRTGPNGVAWDAYVNVSGGAVGSDLDQYVMAKCVVDIDNTVISDFEIHEVVVRSTASSVVVTLPAFTGLSVYEALQKIGEYTLYEFGLDADGAFFFRSRDNGVAAVMDLTESTYNAQISSMDSGYERVYGTVRVTYGDISKEISDDGQFSESPNARVLDRRYDFSPDDNIQIPGTADIATGVAAAVFAVVSQPKRRMKLITKFLPQLDLSDTVTVDLVNNLPTQTWYLGDSTVDLGDDVKMWGDSEQFLKAMQAKVIGARYDSGRWNCEFDLEEITS